MDATYCISRPNVIVLGEVESFRAWECLNMTTSLKYKGFNLSFFGDSGFHSKEHSQKKNIKYCSSTVSPRVYMEGKSRLWCYCSYTYPFYNMGTVSRMSRFSFSSQCQGNDSVAYVNGNLGDAEFIESDNNEASLMSNDSRERSGEEEVEPPELEELRGQLHKASKDLEVARYNSTMFEEKAQKISEAAIVLKNEAVNVWDDVNTSLVNIQETINEEKIAKEGVQKAMLDLSLAEARLQVVVDSLKIMKENKGFPKALSENESDYGSGGEELNSSNENEVALLAAQNEIRECRNQLANCEAELERLQNRKEELQKKLDRLSEVAEQAQIKASKSEEDVANAMLLTDQAVACELTAAQRVDDTEMALLKSENNLVTSHFDALDSTIQVSIAEEFSLEKFENDCHDARCYKSYPIIQPIDSNTFGDWLRSCSNIEEIRKVHAFVVKSTEDPEVFVSNNLISRYVKFGDLVSALRVFCHMSERNVISWTAMINGYQRYGLVNEALRLFTEFVDSGFQGNLKTFACMFSLCSRAFDYELGRQLHACILKSGMSSLILNSAILHFYAQCGDLDSVVHVFDRMQKQDVISWTTMITACSQYGLGQKALLIFSRMLSDELHPNEFTFSSTLNACGEEKKLKFGRQLHGMAVKDAYDMDVYVGTSLVDMYAKCGELEDCRELFDGLNRKNAITWTSIIAGYARKGLGEEAISLYRVMGRLKLFANDITMVSILQACGFLRALSTGKEVHAQVLKNFSPSNIFIGSALVWLYCKCGDYSSSSKVLHYLPEKDVVSWTAMISGCSGLGHEYEALEYLKKMLGEGVEPNSYTYSSALKACAKLENIKQGRLIHSSINKTPASSNVFVGSALVHMYSKCGYLLEAIKVFNSMPEKNMVSWRSMIVAYARNGLCEEALKLMYQMQAEGIEVDDYILSTVLSSCGDFKWDKETSLAHCL